MIHLVMLGIVCRTCDPDNMVSAEIRSTTERHMVLMRCAHLLAVITSPQQAPRIPFVAGRPLHAWGPTGPPEKEAPHSSRLNRRRTNKPPNGGFRAA